MERSKILLAGSIACLATFIFVKQNIFCMDNHDLFLHSNSVDADEVHEPEPGKAYAFHKRGGRFEPTASCVLQGVSRAAPKVEVFHGRNLAGESYNAAIANFAGEIDNSFMGVVLAKPVERKWSLNKQHNKFAGGEFDSACIPVLVERVNNPNYEVYIVDTVYYSDGKMSDAFMVTFKPDPFVLSDCDAGCRADQVDLFELKRTRFLTRIKQGLFDLERTLGST